MPKALQEENGGRSSNINMANCELTAGSNLGEMPSKDHFELVS